MKHLKNSLLLITLLYFSSNYAQEEKNRDYIEFNDRNTVLHGVYIGMTFEVGEIDNKETGFGGVKIAYVADRKLDIGLSGKAFYSQQNLQGVNQYTDLAGFYGGFHIEPILFGASRVNLSFPVLLGAGAVGYVDGNFDDDIDSERYTSEWDAIFIVEPGVSLLYNISRYAQLEVSAKYRFSSKFDILPNGLDNINGFSGGLGIKIGVFNLGRNRYKKQIPDEK